MAKKNTTFEIFIENLTSSSKLTRIDFSTEELKELHTFFDSFYIKKHDSMGKSPIRYIYYFINNNVEASDWVGRIEKIITIGNKMTKDKMILSYGEVEGNRKWDDYVSFQSTKNTFEYKNKKYNMSKDDFDDFNKNRSCTLENMIKRHGEKEGLQKWETYCDRQRYTTSLEYFQKTYGMDAGLLKYNNYLEKAAKNIFILNQRSNCMVSMLETNIANEISNLYEVRTQFVYTDQNVYISPFDIYIPILNLLIEVNGDFWHMNPSIYESSYINPISKISAKQKWHLDKLKLEKAKKAGFNVEVIWESDYKKRKTDLIKEILTKYEKRDN